MKRKESADVKGEGHRSVSLFLYLTNKTVPAITYVCLTTIVSIYVCLCMQLANCSVSCMMLPLLTSSTRKLQHTYALSPSTLFLMLKFLPFLRQLTTLLYLFHCSFFLIFKDPKIFNFFI